MGRYVIRVGGKLGRVEGYLGELGEIGVRAENSRGELGKIGVSLEGELRKVG